jgi:hypothetical protein
MCTFADADMTVLFLCTQVCGKPLTVLECSLRLVPTGDISRHLIVEVDSGAALQVWVQQCGTTTSE